MKFTSQTLIDLQSGKRESTLRTLSYGRGVNIVNLKFTVDQFELLNDLTLDVDFLEDRAFGQNNVNLILYLGKHYKLKCNLQDDANNVEYITTIYRENVDYNDMLGKGFIPCPSVKLPYYREIIEMFRLGMPEDEIILWYGVKDPYAYLCKNVFWSVVSKSYLDNSAQQGDSYPILFFDLDMIYKSMRPKTDMSMFETANSIYYTKLEEDAIPVTRYAKGMSKGLYYGDRPVDKCGYFYYHEPESTTYLTYNLVITSFNKTTAAKLFLKKLPTIDPELAVEIDELVKETERNIEFHIAGLLPHDLMMTRSQFENFYNVYSGEENMIIEGQTPVYVGVKLDMYGKEDDLDQPLCKAARLLGYDLVILTHMVGSHQIVTEILDTRDDSFSHLRFKR